MIEVDLENRQATALLWYNFYINVGYPGEGFDEGEVEEERGTSSKVLGKTKPTQIRKWKRLWV